MYTDEAENHCFQVNKSMIYEYIYSRGQMLPKYKLILRSVESSQVMHCDIMATPA